jgi:DNA-binding GntR family transcriptional regulator
MLPNQTIMYQTREEYVAAQLRRLITQGHIAPGEQIDQSDLAEQLGVSRSPVRDAVRRLAAEGLLCINPHRQAFVPRLTRAEVAEIYHILANLEGLAAFLAVPKMRPNDLQALHALHQQMEGDLGPDQWVKLNARFHSAICDLADSPRLTGIIDNLRTLRQVASPYAREYVTLPENRKKALSSHLKILEACENRNSALAQHESTQHLLETWKDIESTLSVQHPEHSPVARS